MEFELATIDELNNTVNRKYMALPDTCPICHKAGKQIFKFAFAHKDISQAIFQCPRNSCQSFFIAYYEQIGNNQYDYSHARPTEPTDRIFGDEIAEVSKNFCDIYNESAKAEQMGWTQIAGGGYRKALEFLIKDYAIYLEEDKNKHDDIKSKWLSQVIADHVNSDNIKTTAELATWLGNDETHYIRKWTGMDIEDLKKLIELTVKWIEMEVMTKDYKDKMKNKNSAENTSKENN